MKRTKRNRALEILDRLLGDGNTTKEEAAEQEGYIDPTNFLEKRPIEVNGWIKECDDYKLTFLVNISFNENECITYKHLYYNSEHHF